VINELSNVIGYKFNIISRSINTSIMNLLKKKLRKQSPSKELQKNKIFKKKFNKGSERKCN
jgi:hypothetical protein